MVLPATPLPAPFTTCTPMFPMHEYKRTYLRDRLGDGRVIQLTIGPLIVALGHAEHVLKGGLGNGVIVLRVDGQAQHTQHMTQHEYMIGHTGVLT